MTVDVISIGDATRLRAGAVVKASLAMIVVFWIVTVVSKNIPSWYLTQPWQDDPFDVIVSLDYVILPALVGLATVRLALCRRDEGLPARRLRDLLRVTVAGVAVAAATQSVEALAAVLGLHRDVWNVGTVVQMALLAAFIGVTAVLARRITAVGRDVVAMTSLPTDPDALTDLAAVTRSVADRLPRGTRRLGRGAQSAVDAMIPVVHRHPAAIAGAVSMVLAAPFVAAKAFVEGYDIPLLLLVAAFVTTSLFGLVVTISAFLRIVSAPGPPSQLLRATVVGCLCGCVLFALHDSLLRVQTVAGVTRLYAGGLIAGIVATLFVHDMVLRRTPRIDSRRRHHGRSKR